MQRSLFDEDLSCQAYVLGKIGGYVPAMWLSVTEPWNDIQRRRAENDQPFVRLPAEGIGQWMHYGITHRAAELFERHHPEVRILPREYGKSRVFSLIFDDVAVSFKKLRTAALARSNYPTRNQNAYWDASLLGCDDLKSVIFGYQLIKQNTEIKLFITYPGRTGNVWATVVPDQSAAVMRYLKPAVSQGREEERKGFHVQPKHKRSDSADVG